MEVCLSRAAERAEALTNLEGPARDGRELLATGCGNHGVVGAPSGTGSKLRETGDAKFFERMGLHVWRWR